MTADDQHAIAGPISPERLETLSYREAGCAVAFLACGFAIADITDIPDGDNDGVMLDCSRDGLQPTVRLPDLAYVPDFCAMVGQCAMDRFDCGFLSHRADAYTLPRRDDESDNAAWRSLQAEASSFVATRWDQISRLAGALFERGTLTCDEVIATMRNIPVAAGTAFGRPQ